MPLFPLLAPVQLHAYGSALFLFASLCGSSRAQTNPPAELAFTRIFHGWTNYSTAFLATHATVSATDFATVASFYTPSCDVAPVEYAAVFIWHGPTNQSVDFAHYDTQVYFWNSFAAFTNAPRQGDLATFTFSAPTGGNTNLPDAIT